MEFELAIKLNVVAVFIKIYSVGYDQEQVIPHSVYFTSATQYKTGMKLDVLGLYIL